MNSQTFVQQAKALGTLAGGFLHRAPHLIAEKLGRARDSAKFFQKFCRIQPKSGRNITDIEAHKFNSPRRVSITSAAACKAAPRSLSTAGPSQGYAGVLKLPYLLVSTFLPCLRAAA